MQFLNQNSIKHSCIALPISPVNSKRFCLTEFPLVPRNLFKTLTFSPLHPFKMERADTVALTKRHVIIAIRVLNEIRTAS